MYTNLIWLIAIALEAAILFRGLRTGLRKRYPFFYFYLGSLLLIEVFRFLCYRLTPNFYGAFYWHTELVRIVTTFGVIFEIFKRALKHNTGVERRAQTWLLVVFAFALSYAASDFLHGGFSSFARATADLGRYLLYVEGGLLLLILCLFDRYRITFGPNLLGLTLGYAWLYGLDVVNLAFLSTPGHGASIGVRKLIPATHLLTFVIWCVSLWSCQPEPLPPAESAIDQDYASLTAKTRAAFAHLSALVERALRP